MAKRKSPRIVAKLLVTLDETGVVRINADPYLLLLLNQQHLSRVVEIHRQNPPKMKPINVALTPMRPS